MSVPLDNIECNKMADKEKCEYISMFCDKSIFETKAALENLQYSQTENLVRQREYEHTVALISELDFANPSTFPFLFKTKNLEFNEFVNLG